MPFWSKEKEKDPVCGMEVEPKRAAATQEYMGKTYYFCAPGCRANFAKDPEKYLKGYPGAMGGMPIGHHFWSKEKEKDPVCGMEVELKRVADTQEYMGKTYYFCAPGCRANFAEDPEKYLKGPPGAMGDAPMGHH